MTEQQLIERLLRFNAQGIIAIRSCVEPKMLAKSEDGTPNPYRIGKGKNATILVRKRQSLNGLGCPNYQRLVVNRHTKVGSDATPNFGQTWFEVVESNGKPTSLVRHKTTGELYIRFVPMHTGEAEYTTLDGDAVAPEAIAPWLAERSSYSNQNLPEGEEIPHIVLKLESIESISIDGEVHSITR